MPKIADLAPADLDQVAAMMFESFRELSPDWLPDVETARGKVAGALAGGGFAKVLRDDAGEIAGFIGGAPDYGHVWELHPLVVAPHGRKRGYGRLLVAELERHARAAGALTLQLGTSDESDRTSLFGRDLYPDIPGAIGGLWAAADHPLDFYLRLGFRVVGLTPDAEGPGKPTILMAKSLRA